MNEVPRDCCLEEPMYSEVDFFMGMNVELPIRHLLLYKSLKKQKPWDLFDKSNR